MADRPPNRRINQIEEEEVREEKVEEIEEEVEVKEEEVEVREEEVEVREEEEKLGEEEEEAVSILLTRFVKIAIWLSFQNI